MLIPVVTSQDIFSYIIYTRMSVLYHLNPLTTLPIAIRHDALYPYVYWVHQPSAYGPTWVIMTNLLQGIALLVLSLRFTGLLLHLSSALLIWSISGQLQHLNGPLSSSSQNNRMLALLAFAWNPLLLFEACVNAHNDTAILFFVLLAIWALIPRAKGALGFAALAALLFAIAVGLKITMVVLFPGLLLFLWAQNARRILSLSVITVTFVGTIILLYAPFWQHGAVLQLFQVNPAAFHTINTPYEFLIRLIASINGFYVVPYSLSKSAPIERIAHGVSILIFVIVYGIMCVRALLPASRLRTLPELIRWLAIVWLLFCLVGAPWFWPWYLITFFGLHALIETSNISRRSILGMFYQPWATRLLAFSMFSMYWFSTIAPLKTAIPYVPHFQWAYFSGLWIWTLPLLALRLQRKPRISVQSYAIESRPGNPKTKIPVMAQAKESV
jgi:hypothetical protein